MNRNNRIRDEPSLIKSCNFNNERDLEKNRLRSSLKNRFKAKKVRPTKECPKGLGNKRKNKAMNRSNCIRDEPRLAL